MADLNVLPADTRAAVLLELAAMAAAATAAVGRRPSV